MGRFDLPVLRMELFARSIGRPLERAGIEVRRFRFSQQGWNHDGASAMADLGRTIDELTTTTRQELVLVGHSMGGRTSMRFVDHPGVAGVVGLAPWLPAGEPMVDVAGRTIRVAHGANDRTTKPSSSLDFVDRARAAGADARHVLVPGEGHALIRHPSWWNRFIVESVGGIFAAR